MKPVPVLLMVAFVLGVQAQDLTPRTFGFLPSRFADQPSHHNPPAHTGHQHGGHASQSQGHHNAVLPAHQPHAGHAHQAAVNVHPGHVVPEHHGGHGHVHNHPSSSASPGTAVRGPSNAGTVPVLVCRVIQVPVTPAAPATSSSGGGALVPPAVFGNITTSLETVVGRVVDPVVALLHGASVWLNRTAHRHRDHGSHVHPHQHSSLVSAVDVVRQEVLALKKHKNPTHPGSVQTPVAHATTPGTPDRSVTSTVAPTTAAITPARVPAQVFTSTVGAPAPRLFTEPSPPQTQETSSSFTLITLGTSVSSTEGSTYADVPSSVTPSVSEAVSVKSGYVFTTQATATASSAPSSTQAEELFELTPRAQNSPSTPELCRLLTLRCERRFRRRLCRLYEECLLNGTRRRECLAALTSVVSSDERCTRA